MDPLSAPFKVQFPSTFSPKITRLSWLLAVCPWSFPTLTFAEALEGMDSAMLAGGDGSALTQHDLCLTHLALNSPPVKSG